MITIRIVFFDIEATDLNANWGRLLCCSFLEWDENGFKRPYTFRSDERRFRGKSRTDDSKLARAIRDELEKYSLIVGWNSKMYDAPFINGRLMRLRQRPLNIQFHVDAMYYAGGCSNRIGSKKLDNVAKFLHLENQKTPLLGEVWQNAAAGDKKALDMIVKHCEADVKVLREAYTYLLPSIKNIHR